ncbi:MAG TPA: thermonuclease family protein [Parvibaculum sp.]|jgi:endonuclease YncB( thermonuclease family)
MIRLLIFLSLFFAAFVSQDARAAEVIEGPVEADVVRVIDGDTLKLEVHIWLGQTVEVDVRVAGIDAPELKGKCPAERAKAAEARDYLTSLVGDRAIRIARIRNDKYGGRVIADVSEPEIGDVASVMLARGLARAYDGGKREPWCQAGS